MKTPWNSATRMGVATALAVSTIFVASAATAAPLNPVVGYTIIKLVQDAPAIENIQPGSGRPGQTAYFEAGLARSGKPYGELHGTTVIDDVTPDGSGVETRLRTLVFDLPDGQVVAMGTSNYDLPLVANVPVVRSTATIAIVGGTETYAAARGQVTTVRRTDGTYEHVLMLLK